MITKAMLAKCQNELGQAFGFLPQDVKQAMLDNNEHLQRFNHYYGEYPAWEKAPDNPMPFKERVFRLSPDTPTEPEVDWVEVPVKPNWFGAYEVQINGLNIQCLLGYATSLVKILGIVYEKDGVETLRTSVDAAFGVPKRVRLRK